MKVRDLIKATSGEIFFFDDLDFKYNNIRIDSRLVTKNDIFIAIKGKRFDGNDFINDACLVITSKRLDVPHILVKDTVKAMRDIASYMIDKYKPKVIAITGSVGKTTTRNILYTILSSKYNVLTSEKNYNNNIGVPLTIFNLNSKTDILLLELGMNHLGEISYLSKMVKPDISIITNIGTSHIGILKSKENILKAKLEILDGMDNKILYVNGDDIYLRGVYGTIRCGFNECSDFKGYNLDGNLYFSSFDIMLDSNYYTINIPLSKHLMNNVLTSIKVSLDLGVSIENIINSLKKYKTVNNRMEIFFDSNNNTIISDCYNSSYESLAGVLDVLKNDNCNKLLILGDINEIGSNDDIIYEKISNIINEIDNKNVVLIGSKIIKISNDYLCFKNYQEAIKYFKSVKIKDTLILIKASRSLNLENITNYFLNI